MIRTSGCERRGEGKEAEMVDGVDERYHSIQMMCDDIQKEMNEQVEANLILYQCTYDVPLS